MAKKISIQGLWTALVTPFRRGKVDREGLEHLVLDQIQAKVRGITLLGTTAETATLESDEKELIYRSMRDLVPPSGAGDCLLMAGVGTNSTKATLEELKRAAFYGIDCALVVNPYYNKPTQEGLLAHFLTIADASEIPIVLYNIPGRACVALEQATLLELLDHPQIIGIKEATGHLQNIDFLQRERPEAILLSGDDFLTFPKMCLGAHGAVSVCSNLLPRSLRKLIDLSEQGDMKTARVLHQALSPFLIGAYCETSPAPMKYLLSKKFSISEELRLPLVPPREASKKFLDTLYVELLENPLFREDFIGANT